jgi:hypothetical protein
MRHEVYPIGPCQRGHVRQASKATGLDNIRLHNVDPGLDEALDALQGILLLTR